MAFTDNDDLSRAMAGLTVFDVWERAFRDGAVIEAPPASRRCEVVRSPFREDGKSGSFSICAEGRGFKDFGGTGTKGGVWKFHELCWPNCTKGERAKQLIEWSGITVTAPSKSTGGNVPDGTDSRIVQAAKRLDQRARRLAQEDAVYRELDDLLRHPEVKAGVAWPECVLDRWEEGVASLAAAPEIRKELARDRGWPLEWVEWLCESNLLSRPLERWSDFGQNGAKRQKAFRVDVPQFGAEGAVRLMPVGYHQRMFIDGVKSWLYVPSLPKNGARSELERGIVAAAVTRFAMPEAEVLRERRSMVPPAPFVLGNLTSPKWIAVLEGQWDAITFAGAMGFFHDTAEPDGAVFGVRGVQGIEAFLGYWWPWLQRVKPRAWVVAQSDPAAKIWREAPPAAAGVPRAPSLAERLAAAGCVRPVVSWFKPGTWGKDFNDYFRAKGGAERVPQSAMRAWMRKLGIDG